MKINFKNFFVFVFVFSVLGFLLQGSLARAIDLTSTNFTVRDPIIGTLGNEGATSANFTLISAGHTSLSDIGGTSANFQIRYGFLYYDDTEEGTITFDLDTTATNDCTGVESAAPYTVALGVVSTSSVQVSGATDSINHICVDLDTNASGGAVVTVRNANGANGMASTSVPADNINSSDGTMAAGTERYGLCIVSQSQTSGVLDDEGGYNGDTCAANSETNGVQELSSSGENIFDTNGAAVVGGRGQIAVNAAISTITPAHNDYVDSLTFIATGTF